MKKYMFSFYRKYQARIVSGRKLSWLERLKGFTEPYQQASELELFCIELNHQEKEILLRMLDRGLGNPENSLVHKLIGYHERMQLEECQPATSYIKTEAQWTKQQ